MNLEVSKVHSVYFIHRLSLANVMGYKTTTDVFILRGETDLSINGTSGGATSTISTNLDTLNREVLLVWEVDIQDGGFPTAVTTTLIGGASMHSVSISDSVQTVATFVDLANTDYIAGKDTTYAGGGAPNPVLVVSDQRNPDTRDFPSRDKMPLAIITDNELTLRSGYTATTTMSSSPATYQAKFRIMAQRAKADADTYAALVTGLM